MRSTRLTKRMTFVATLGIAVAAALTAPTVAKAGDDDVPFDEQILRNILTGIGLKDPNAPSIDYQERSPLVIPPDSTLPPPAKAGAAVAGNPNWPKDPDVTRAKLARERAKNRNTTDEMLHEMYPLRPDELNPKGSKRAARSGGGAPAEDDPRATGYGYSLLSPSELGYKGGLFSNMFSSEDRSESARFTGEPTRTSLTDPPPGYQTPSPDQPYGIGKDRTPPKADNNYITRGEAR
jgi:hypothetical protein